MGLFARFRKTDPQTSVEAAASVKDLPTTQERVLKIFQVRGPMNDEALADIWEYLVRHGKYPLISDSGLRSRRAELVARGLLEDSGRRVKMRSGRNSIVWQVVK
jgi:hypothetical protein